MNDRSGSCSDRSVVSTLWRAVFSNFGSAIVTALCDTIITSFGTTAVVSYWEAGKGRGGSHCFSY